MCLYQYPPIISSDSILSDPYETQGALKTVLPGIKFEYTESCDESKYANILNGSLTIYDSDEFDPVDDECFTGDTAW